MERLEVLIFGPDPNLFRIVRAALEDPGIAGCHFRTDSAQATAVLARQHFDGIILDCDVLPCAQEVLSKIRQGPSNRQSQVIAILNDRTALPAIQNYAANFTVFKPVSAATVKAQLTKALDAMQEEYRRYFRYPVTLPLLVSTGKYNLTAELMNVSADGMAIRVSRSLNPEEIINLRFDLPSIDPYPIEAKAEVIWTDAQGRMGIKLSHMPATARQRYTEWLGVLHAQHELRRLTEEARATQTLTL